MEKITTEKYLGTLFRYGFEQVDPLLYTLTLGALGDNDLISKDKFDFSEDEPLSAYFKEYIESNGIVYRMKKDNEHCEKYFKFYSSKELLDTLDNLDFGKIISKKLNLYGISSEEMDTTRFSQKEIDLFHEYEEKNQPWFKKVFMISKEKEQMRTSTNYIEWMIGYAKKQEEGKFSSIDWLPDNVSKEDKSNISKLGVFIRAISEYVAFEPSVSDINNFKLEYKGTVIKITELFYQGIIDSAEIVTSEKDKEEAIDFNRVIEYYKTKKDKKLKLENKKDI